MSQVFCLCLMFSKIKNLTGNSGEAILWLYAYSFGDLLSDPDVVHLCVVQKKW